MRTHTLRELAKIGAGLVLGDFLALAWIAANNLLPMTFLGVTMMPSMVVPAMIFDASAFVILIHYGWRIGKTPTLREHTFLVMAGVVFGVVAIAHFMRVLFNMDLTLFGWQAPIWLSWIGTVAAAYLSYMSFHLAVAQHKHGKKRR